MSVVSDFRQSSSQLLRDQPAIGPEALVEFGLVEAFSDRSSGTELLQVFFEEQGRQRASTGALDLLATSLTFGQEARDHYAFPGYSRQDRSPGWWDEDYLEVDVLLLVAGPSEPELTLVAEAPDGWDSVRVPLDAVRVDAGRPLDQSTGLTLVRGRVPSEQVQIDGPVAWAPIVATCQLAIAAELVGLAQECLSLASTHVTNREQFGQPLSARQVVKHRLADAAVAIEAARSFCTATIAGPTPHEARVAKALAGRAALLAADTAQQLCGAIGFTVEHPITWYVRRAYQLDGLLGSADFIRQSLGSDAIASRTMPSLVHGLADSR